MSRRQATTIIAALALCFTYAAAQVAGPDAGEEGADDPPPALASFGISAGFPSYQTIAPAISLQSGHFGVQLKASWTPAGPYVGVQLRGYPPVSLPVPLFLGVGAGVYGNDVSYHAALGAHVPLGLALRLDLEAGVASVPLLGDRHIAPHLAAGISYAIPVQTGAGSSVSGGDREAATTCRQPREPDESALRGAVSRVVDEWILSARATYGSVYTQLRYSYDIVSTAVNGDAAEVVISYSGSVREIATGQRLSASGEASATFRWNGCGWSNTGVSY